MNKELEYWDGVPMADIADAACPIDILDHCLSKIEPCLNSGLIFELGCGNGRLIGPMANRCKKNQYVGIDFSDNMIQFVPRGYNLRYLRNDGKSIPTAERLFDSGYSMLMFQHVTSDVFYNYLKEVFRVLKPGGVFRFQFVHGSENVFLARNVIPDDVVFWVKEAGLTLIDMEQDEKFETWKWVTCKK